MNDELKILISGVLNVDSSSSNINKQLDELSSRIKNLDININLDKNTLAVFQKIQKNVELITQALTGQNAEIQTSINKANQLNQSVEIIQKNASNTRQIEVISKEQLKDGQILYETIDDVLREYEQFNKVKVVNQIFDPATKELKAFNLELENAEGKIEKLGFQLQNTVDAEGKVTEGSGFLQTSLSELDKVAQRQEQIGKTSYFIEQANERMQKLTRTFGEGSEEINKVRNAIAQLPEAANNFDFQKITDEIKKLEQSEKLLNQAYKENDAFNEKRAKDIAQVENRIKNLTSEIQKFNRAGKELPVGKVNELDKVLDGLKNIDVSNISEANTELGKLEKTFQRLDKTASARTGLLNKLGGMKLTGVIDESKINDLESRVLKAESPEQIQLLAKEYGKLYTQQVNYTQVIEKKKVLEQQALEMKQRGLLTEKQLNSFELQTSQIKNRQQVKEAQAQRTILLNQEKEIQNERVLREDISKKLAIEKERLRISAQSLIQSQPKANRSGINSLVQDFSNLDASSFKNMKELQSAITAANLSMRQYRVDAQGAIKSTNTLAGAFRNAMINFVVQFRNKLDY